MGNRSKYFKSSWLKHGDLPAEGAIVKVSDCTDEVFIRDDGKEDLRATLHFGDTGLKPLPLNATNYDVCALIAKSDESKDFIGLTIKLESGVSPYNGVNTVLVKPTDEQAGQMQVRPITKASPKANDLDDEIQILKIKKGGR